MDRKSLIILVASFVLLMLWYPLTNRLFPPTPLPRHTNLVSTNLDLALTNQAASNVAETPVPSAPIPAPPVRVINTNAPEQTLTIENQDVRYTFTSHGGGLKY